MKAFSSPRRRRPFQITILNLIFYLLVCATEAQPQARGAFTVNEITELLKSGVSATRLVQLVESHGVAFDLDDRTLRRLKEDGATNAVLSSVKKMSLRFAEEKKRIRQEQEEVAKRLREEEAKRRETKEKEQRRLAELERKKQEEAKQRAEEKRQREHDEARRREEAKRRADEQKHQQDEAEKARLAEERRRQEETRLSEEKRRAQEAARVAEVERKKSEELIAKRKIEEEKRRSEARSWMLDQMKSGYASAPTYNKGDFWYFNVVENFTVYDSRALKGVSFLRYSGEGFQVFQEKQRLSAKEAQIGALFALVNRKEICWSGSLHCNAASTIRLAKNARSSQATAVSNNLDSSRMVPRACRGALRIARPTTRVRVNTVKQCITSTSFAESTIPTTSDRHRILKHA